MIKSINTHYDGHYFRSRLEARWAAFFVKAGIQYTYEPEGVVLPNGECYLPDFYLPLLNCYAEVKPGLRMNEWDEQDLKKATIQHCDYSKWRLFAEENILMLLIGSPVPHSYPVLTHTVYRPPGWQDEIEFESFYFDRKYAANAWRRYTSCEFREFEHKELKETMMRSYEIRFNNT